MKSAVKIRRFGMVEVSVHWTFILLVIWILAANLLSGFSLTQLGWSLLLLICGTACLLLHELAHAAVSAALGLQPQDFVLIPLGDIPSAVSRVGNFKQEALIRVAGPLSNLLVAGILMVFIHPYESFWSDTENLGAPTSGSLIFQLHIVNLAIAILNLIPAFPLDGGRILCAALATRWAPPRAMRMAIIVGRLVVTLLILCGLMYGNIFFCLAGISILLIKDHEPVNQSPVPHKSITFRKFTN